MKYTDLRIVLAADGWTANESFNLWTYLVHHRDKLRYELGIEL